MSLAVKPHTVTVQPVTEPVDTGDLSVSVPSLGTAVTVACHLYPTTPGEAYQSHGVMLKRPHICLIDIADAGSFHFGYRVTKGARVFTVSTEPELFDADTDAVTDYARLMLEEERIAE